MLCGRTFCGRTFCILAPSKKAYSHDMFAQKRRAEKQLFAWHKKGKRQPAQRKAPRIKKRIAYSDSGWRCRREKWSTVCDDDDDGWEPVMPITSLCDTILGYWGLSAKKVRLNRQTNAYTVGVGLGSHLTTNHVIGNRTVNMTLAKGHQTDPAHCQKFTNFSHDCSTPNFLYIILLYLGKKNIARIDSHQYSYCYYSIKKLGFEWQKYWL